MSKKFVITGGAGFIGSNLAEALANENEVVVIDDLSTGMAENLAGLEVQLLKGCITDFGLLKDAFEGADCIFHQAGIASVKKSIEDPVRTDEVGIEGTLKVLIAAKDAGVRRVILASSAAVYGSSPELPKKEDMMPEPKSPYAVTKLAGEHYARVFRELYGLETVALRYFNVFGPKHRLCSGLQHRGRAEGDNPLVSTRKEFKFEGKGFAFGVRRETVSFGSKGSSRSRSQKTVVHNVEEVFGLRS
jgi:UDP-glucose 4-epimerase